MEIKKFDSFNINESVIIEKDLEELEKLKKSISIQLQRYQYLIDSSKDLDQMDREVIIDKLEELKSDVDSRLEELKANIWFEK